MKKALFAAVVAAGISTSAHAAIIYNNFGPSFEYDTSSSWVVTPEQSIAVEFSVSETVSLSSVLVGLDGAANYEFSINDGSGGAPGTELASWSRNITISPAMYSMDEMEGTILDAGTYFFVAESTGNGGWNTNSIGMTGGWMFTWDNNWTPSTFDTPVLQITGEAVPEPATIAILGLGVAGLIKRRKRA